MPETIMPCFDRFPREGSIIGRLLAGYGELELELCRCAIAVKTDLDGPIRAMFGQRGEETRIRAAKQLIGDAYQQVGLGAPYTEAISDMNWCRQIRNQYSHFHWYDTYAEGLCIFSVEEIAKQTARITSVTDKRHFLDVDLLEHQESFFKYVQKVFWFLESEYCVRAGRPSSPRHIAPPKVERPRMCN
jgi:hypothetical protein